MKKEIVFTILFLGNILAYSQTDSLLLVNYEQKILENGKLKSDLQTEKRNFSDLSDAYKKDTLALQKQIKDLLNELSSEKQKVSDLNKNKIKVERDNLQTQIDSLNSVISKQNQTIIELDNQITYEKKNTKTTYDKAKSEGKAEAFGNIVDFYKNNSFDELIKSSSQESIARDIKLVGDNTEVKMVLNDLQIYFNALKLLSEKIDAVKIKSTQTQLSQIKQKSKLLDDLKVNFEYYEDFNIELKKTIEKLVELDKSKSAAGSPEIQKLKFNEIITILTDYMYNYYDYTNYPYLTDIILEIIKRKQPNADSPVVDLYIKL